MEVDPVGHLGARLQDGVAGRVTQRLGPIAPVGAVRLGQGHEGREGIEVCVPVIQVVVLHARPEQLEGRQLGSPDHVVIDQLCRLVGRSQRQDLFLQRRVCGGEGRRCGHAQVERVGEATAGRRVGRPFEGMRRHERLHGVDEQDTGPLLLRGATRHLGEVTVVAHPPRSG